MTQEPFALRSSLCLRFQAVEKPLAQFIFQFLELLAQGGLGDLTLRGGARKVARPHDRYDVAKLLHLPRQQLWWEKKKSISTLALNLVNYSTSKT